MKAKYIDGEYYISQRSYRRLMTLFRRKFPYKCIGHDVIGLVEWRLFDRKWVLHKVDSFDVNRQWKFIPMED
jgi:hypothetical protein